MNFLNDMRTGTKLTASFAVLIILLGIVAVMGYTAIGTAVSNEDTMFKDNLKPVSYLATANAELYRIRGNLYRALVLHTLGNTAEAEATKAESEKAFGTIRGEIEKLRSSKLNADEVAKLQTFEQALADFERASAETGEQSRAGKTDAAVQTLLGSATKARKAVDTAITSLIETNLAKAEAMAKSSEAEGNRNRFLMLVLSLIAVATAMFLSWVIGGAIAKPLGTAVDFLREVAKGDVSREMPAAILVRKDEIGSIGRAVQGVSTALREIIGEIGSGVHALGSSSGELTTIAREVATAAGETQRRSSGVANAAEQMSSGAMSAAAGMEEAVTNLASVASATEEMSATISDIANNSEKARSISGEATRQANQVSSLMHELGKAAQEVGKVTETITSISAQTNLLALNATIEAARAGAAGKGFAVVANEIKELAQQTASATEDIKAKIFGIQNSTGSAVADIEKIGQVIREVSEIVSTIATAIEEQASVTKDIAGNISQASTGVQDANRRVAETSSMTRQIATDIATVTSAATQMSASGQQVETSSHTLTSLADQLRHQVEKFRT